MAHRTSIGAVIAIGAALLSAAASADLPAPVPGYPIGWCIRATPGAFADAKSGGFEYVELAFQDVLGLSEADFMVLRAQLNTLGVDAFSGYNAIPADIRLVGPGINEPLQNEHIDLVLRRAKTLELEYIVLNSGGSWRVPDGGNREKAFSELVAFGQRFAGAAARVGIGVLVGPLRSTDTNMITTISEAVRLVEAVDRPNFALMVDYSFLRIQKDDVSALMDARTYLRHVHIANPEGGRTYPMDSGESDYASFFKVLKEIGYRGRFSVHARTESFNIDAPRAITFLRAQAQQLASR